MMGKASRGDSGDHTPTSRSRQHSQAQVDLPDAILGSPLAGRRRASSPRTDATDAAALSSPPSPRVNIRVPQPISMPNTLSPDRGWAACGRPTPSGSPPSMTGDEAIAAAAAKVVAAAAARNDAAAAARSLRSRANSLATNGAPAAAATASPAEAVLSALATPQGSGTPGAGASGSATPKGSRPGAAALRAENAQLRAELADARGNRGNRIDVEEFARWDAQLKASAKHAADATLNEGRALARQRELELEIEDVLRRLANVGAAPPAVATTSSQCDPGRLQRDTGMQTSSLDQCMRDSYQQTTSPPLRSVGSQTDAVRSPRRRPPTEAIDSLLVVGELNELRGLLDHPPGAPAERETDADVAWQHTMACGVTAMLGSLKQRVVDYRSELDLLRSIGIAAVERVGIEELASLDGTARSPFPALKSTAASRTAPHTSPMRRRTPKKAAATREPESFGFGVPAPRRPGRGYRQQR